MNYQAYFPAVKQTDRSPSKKEIERKSSNHIRNNSHAIDLSSKQKESVYPANSRTKSKETVQKGNSVSKLENSNKNNENVEIDISQVSRKADQLKSNYGEFNKCVLRQKTNPIIKINLSSKVANKSSNNAENSFHVTSNQLKSSDVSYDKSLKYTGAFAKPERKVKDETTSSKRSKSSNNMQKKIEVDSLEDLHYFYVNVFKQNKTLAFKFEGIFDDCEFKENYEF